MKDRRTPRKNKKNIRSRELSQEELEQAQGGSDIGRNSSTTVDVTVDKNSSANLPDDGIHRVRR